MNIKKSLILFTLLSAMTVSSLHAEERAYLLPVSSEKINQASAENYDQVLKSSTVLNNADAKMVKKVGKKIAGAVEKYYTLNPELKRPKGTFDWEFNLLKDDTPNAWCMPGGKVAVYTGILPYTKNETGLAVVMSHEISHAILEHGKKQTNAGVVKNIGGIAAKVIGAKVGIGSNAASTAYNYAAGLGTLKYSRTHETQADEIGLVLMQLAGYDPSKALGFWERMASGNKNSTPQFLSTHPSDATRIANIEKYLASEKFKKLTH